MMRFVLCLAAVVFIAATATVFAYPAAAAVACPSCYCFKSLDDGLYVDGAMSMAEQAHARKIVAEARGKVSAFYGSLEGRPRILICVTQDCYGRVGGGSRGMAMLDAALILAPGGTNPVIAAHELSHIELHRRIGWTKTFEKAIPQWFDEGLAVVVSGDPRYLKPQGAADRCMSEPASDLPVTRGDWVAHVERDDLYPKAACWVLRWMQARGGPAGIVRLAEAIGDGADFAEASR